MTEMILRDIDPLLSDRIRRIAEGRRWTLPQTLAHLVEQGLYAVEAEMNVRFSDKDSDVLREAIAALESVPSDPGFSLIGRVERPRELDVPELDLTLAVDAFLDKVPAP